MNRVRIKELNEKKRKRKGFLKSIKMSVFPLFPHTPHY